MPKRDNREYRTMPMLSNSTDKRLNSEHYVEGYATTFDDPYEMFENGGIKYYEKIDRNALKGADLSDVLFQFNHRGMVFARTKMKQGRSQTLLLEPDEKGLFIAADLSTTEEARKMHEAIDVGLIYQMSWGFVVAEDSYDRETHTRTILKIKKVYDVSAVDLPANPSTDISSRSYFEGVIEAEQQEFAERQKQLQRINILTGGRRND